MKRSKCSHQRVRPGDKDMRAGRGQAYWLTRWLFANSILAGIFALTWLVLRSGSKPSRFAYPCQQAALSTATLAFGVPVV